MPKHQRLYLWPCRLAEGTTLFSCLEYYSGKNSWTTLHRLDNIQYYIWNVQNFNIFADYYNIYVLLLDADHFVLVVGERVLKTV